MGWAWNTQCSEIPCCLRFLGVHEKRVRCHPRVPDFALLFKMQEAWRRKWHPTPLFLPGESHGQRSLEGYSPRGLKESDTSEPLSLPLHGMIFKSKLTVIIKFSLHIKKKKNIRDTKGTFHAKMGLIKDRNCVEEKQKILRRGGKNTQKNCTKKIFTTQIIRMVWSLT